MLQCLRVCLAIPPLSVTLCFFFNNGSSSLLCHLATCSSRILQPQFFVKFAAVAASHPYSIAFARRHRKNAENLRWYSRSFPLRLDLCNRYFDYENQPSEFNLPLNGSTRLLTLCFFFYSVKKYKNRGLWELLSHQAADLHTNFYLII